MFYYLECSKDDCEVECTVGDKCFFRLCTGVRGAIKCPSNSTLRISRAWWGRISPTICPISGQNVDDCKPSEEMQAQQLANLTRVCNNETNCEVRATYNFADECGKDLLGDPCPNKGKYLELNFTCEAGAGKSYLFLFSKFIYHTISIVSFLFFILPLLWNLLYLKELSHLNFLAGLFFFSTTPQYISR